ncbi:MAG: TonB-dependent receptor [Alistipes sp.]|nr:TonB-dependent receptor [Alistipes sp.]
MKKLFTTIVALLVLCAAATAQNVSKQHNHAAGEKCEATIHGHVIDSHTKEHIPYITVTIDGTTIGTTTDSTGHYTLYHVPVGKFKVSVSAIGYANQSKEVEVECGSDLLLNFETSESQISLDAVVVSANRNETTRREAPSLVNILDSDLLNKVSAPTIAEGLSFQPGVRVENSCQNCGFAQVRINGLDGQYSQILINSRPIFSALAGVYGLEHIPANMVERIEVVRGGGSALYGSSAIGGTINIITKEPLRNSGELSHTLTSLGVTGALDNNTTLNASLVTDDRKAGLTIYGQSRLRDAYDHDGDGFVEIPTITSQTIGTQAYVKTSAYNKLTLDYHVTNEYRRGGDRLDLPPHEAWIAETTDHLINSGGLTFEGTSKDSRHRYSAFASAQATKRDSYYGAEMNENAYGKTTGVTAVAGAQYLYRIKFFELTTGVEYSYDYLYDNPVGYAGTEGYSSMVTKQHIHNVSALAQGEFKFKKWGFLVGGRLDNWYNASNKKFLCIPSPRVTLRYNPTRNINLRATYGSGFRAPQAFDEDLHILIVGGERTRIRLAEDLKEERSHTFTVSGDLYHTFGRVQTNLLVEGFYTMLNDVFALRDYAGSDLGTTIKPIPGKDGVYDVNDGARMYERYNGSGATVMGLNIEAKVAYMPWVEVSAGVTLQRSRYKEPEQWSDTAEPTLNMFRSPNVYGYFTISTQPVKGFKIDLSGNYMGRMYMQHFAGGMLPDGSILEKDRIEHTKAFFDLGAKLSYDFKIWKSLGMQVNAGVRNILNSYQKDFDRGASRDSGYIYGPSLPRSVFVGAKLFF